jgi:hypothetical protein
MLRDELGRSNNVAVGVDDLPRLKYRINKAYETLYDMHDWPHLRRTFAKMAISAGQYIYDFPSGLNYERIERAWVWWNDLPIPVKRGITVSDYVIYDPTADVRQSPIQKYDIRSTTTSSNPQLEVWPLPADNGMTLQFMGHRSISPLVNNIDVCLLDDHLLVTLASAGLMKEQDDRQAALAEVQDRLNTLRANTHSDETPIRIGLEPAEPESWKSVTIRVT